MVSFRSDSPLSVLLFLMGCPVRSNKCTFTVHSCENILFFSSADFTWTRYDKQEQKRTEKYFIRASVEAVTTQIHPPCCLSGFSSHTHTNRDGRGGGLRVRAEQLSDVGFWVEKGGSFLGEVGEAVRSCRRGQIAVELQPTFIWSRREFCRLSGVGFWFTLWQEPTENTHELFLKSRKRVLQHAAAAQPLLLNHRCTHHVKCWLRSAGF